MLIGRPLLRRCRSPSKLTHTTPPHTAFTAAHIIAIGCPGRYRAPLTTLAHCRWRNLSRVAVGRGGRVGLSGLYYSTAGGSNRDHHPSSTTNNGRDQSQSGTDAASTASQIGLNVKLPSELADDLAFDEEWVVDDLTLSSPQRPAAPIESSKPTDEDVLHIIDKRQRERASQHVAGAKSAGPSMAVLEDTSRFLLRQLLEKEPRDRRFYKQRGNNVESDSDIELLQKAVNMSVSRIQPTAKPGYHPLPFYMHRNSKTLDRSLKNVLRTRDHATVNKVCYNLLVSDAAPTIATFNILIHRFTRLRMTDLARVILTTLFGVGFEPNAPTYAALLHYLTIIGDYDAFGKAVSIMRNTFVDFRNPVLGAAELNGWSKFGDFTSMRRRLRLLQEEGLRDDIYILAIEMRYFAKRQMWEGGLPALKLLLAKNVEDIDHRVLFWAFKLCVNCQQYDFAERLKFIVQEKRWPVEALWTRPSRSRGLPFGYKGRESGHVTPKGSDPPQWVAFWDADGLRKKKGNGLALPNIKVESVVPRDYTEYSSLRRDQTVQDEVIMQSRGESILGARPTAEVNDVKDEMGTSEMEPMKFQIKGRFKTHTNESLFRTLVHNRKKILFGRGQGRGKT
ncbi:hypothetical protein H072_5968 [Dactylellina haptotyla CBS 200.50]|uniref:Uncharacterized protein n=1 Tax=Dactylellina haptotyla (strain CBS 200.50) TaxID=1284197 RepID=S8BLC2_DACHA|nr:hypothetical protein H072_5968 [Dactylellina haptotyla CBS 200.50]